MINSISVIIFSIVLVLVFLFISYFGLVYYFLGFTFIICLFWFLTNSKNIVVFFLIFIPTNDIFSKDDFLFSVIGFKQIMVFFVVLYYLKNYRNIIQNLKVINSTISYKKFILSIETLILLLIIYFNYTYYKNANFSLHDFDLITAILKSINMTGYLVACLFSFRIALTLIPVNEINRLMICSVLFMLTLSFLSPILPSLGLRSVGTEKTEFENIGLERYTGIIVDGDSNTLSVYAAMTIGICLLFYSYYQKKLFIGLVIPLSILIGVAGSRTGIIVLFVVLIIFYSLIKNSLSRKSKVQFLFLFPILVLISIPFFELIFNRFYIIGEQLNLETSSNRIGKWILYFNFFLENKITFLTGSQKELLITWDERFYAAHNVFITLIYNSGLFFSLYFLLIMIRLIWYSVKYKFYDLLILIIPSFILINFVSDLGILYPMMLYMIILLKNKFSYQYFNSVVLKNLLKYHWTDLTIKN